jgi:hypothetical protein
LRHGRYAPTAVSAPRRTRRRPIAVNLRLTDPDTVAAIPEQHFDGLHRTSEPMMDGRTIKDMGF